MLLHRYFRLIPSVAFVAACVVSPVFAQPAPPLPSRPGAASLLPTDPTWVFNFESIDEHSAPSLDSDPIVTLKQFTYLAIRDYQGEWAEVFNPRTQVTGFVPSDALGPTDPPPAYITAEPPPGVDEINQDGRSTRGAPLSFYTTPD